jgi:hypothetical protein
MAYALVVATDGLAISRPITGRSATEGLLAKLGIVEAEAVPSLS